MKNCMKIYLHTLIISIVFILFPWILTWFDFLSKLKVLEWYGSIFAAVAFILSLVYIFRQVKNTKSKCVLILLNPAFMYLIVMIILRILFFLEAWEWLL